MANPRILIVDDEPLNVDYLEQELEGPEFETVTATNGQEALERIRREPPDLILLDIMMPVMDGWSVLEELRSLPEAERPRVVVVSARASLRDRAKASELGADAFIPKPFNVEDLLAVVDGLKRAS